MCLIEIKNVYFKSAGQILRTKNRNLFFPYHSVCPSHKKNKITINKHSQLPIWVSLPRKHFVITLVTKLWLKLTLSQLETEKDTCSFKLYIHKGIYTSEAFKDKHMNKVSPSQQTKIAFPTEVLRWRVIIMRPTGNGQSLHGCSPQPTTVEGLATITAYLHNHIYAAIKLILSEPNKTLLKINQTTCKSLLSAGSHQLWLVQFLPLHFHSL